MAKYYFEIDKISGSIHPKLMGLLDLREWLTETGWLKF